MCNFVPSYQQMHDLMTLQHTSRSAYYLAAVSLIGMPSQGSHGMETSTNSKNRYKLLVGKNGKKKVTKTTIVGGRIVRTQVDDLNPLSTTSSNIRSLQSLRNKAKQDKDNQREKNVNTLNESGQDESLKYSRDIRKGAHRLQ